MAFVTDPQDDELDSSGPLVPGGAPAPTAPSTGGAAKPTSQPKGSGRFADLGEYLRVNQPQQFGQQLASKVGSDVDGAQNALGSAANEFKSRADQSTIQDSQGLIGQVGTNPENIDQTAFSGLRDAEYRGPTTFQSASDLYNQTAGAANAAAGKAQASKSEGGRFALLDNYYGRPQYSQGQRTLDNLLVQNDPNSQQAFKQIQDNAKNLQANVAQTGNELGAYGTQAKAATESTRKSARDALGLDNAGNLTGQGAVGEAQSGVNSRLSEYQQRAQEIQKARDEGRYSDISPEMASILQQIGTPYGVNAGQYLSSTNPTELTAAGVTSGDEQARLRALYNLSGIDNPYDTTDAGSMYDKPLYGFKDQDYRDKVSGNKRAFETALAPLQEQKTQTQTNISGVQSILDRFGNIMTSYKGPDGRAVRGRASDLMADLRRQATDIDKQTSNLYGQYGLDYGTPAVGGGVVGGGIR
jgi:hypothetical protein